MTTRQQCVCLERGADGTQNHTAASGRTFVSVNTASSIEPCENHVRNYATSPVFVETLRKKA
jgi:hypothetical protein